MSNWLQSPKHSWKKGSRCVFQKTNNHMAQPAVFKHVERIIFMMIHVDFGDAQLHRLDEVQRYGEDTLDNESQKVRTSLAVVTPY